MSISISDRYRGCVFGCATCDSLGTPAEFIPRGGFDEITTMRGGGKLGLHAGEWTDDTSMGLCIAESIIETKTLDTDDQYKRYIHWYDEGHLSSTGECFDIGKCTVKAIGMWRKSTNDGTKISVPGKLFGPETEEANGNGALMRCFAVPLAFRDSDKLIQNSALAAKTTHGGIDSTTAVVLYSLMIESALRGDTKNQILSCYEKLPSEYSLRETLSEIFIEKSYITKTRDEIQSSGWVVKSVEAALWCFYRTESFEEGALLAVNLGDDADTVAAIYGQLAGAHYGIDSIPKDWLAVVALPSLLRNISDSLLKFSISETDSQDEYIEWSKNTLRQLEQQTSSLLKRTRPGPRMFRVFSDYTMFVDSLIKENSNNDDIDQVAVKEFTKVWWRHSTQLEERFSR